MRHSGPARRVRASQSRGFTLIELLVAVAVLAVISMLVYEALSGLERTREGMTRVSDRYHEGRAALRRIADELSAAYISAHRPFDQSLTTVKTAFVATTGNPAARIDFNSFCNRRLNQEQHASDQAEIGYFGEPSTELSSATDLVRRVSARPDDDPLHGGRIQVLATDIDLFELRFLDPMTSEWIEKWDSTQGLEQQDRLPLQVRVLLVLNGGARRSVDGSRQALRFVTKVPLSLRNPLTFGL
jgi:general secretion pathway protein J